MATPNNSFGNYVAGKPTVLIPPTLSLFCEKINTLPANKKILLKFVVSGISKKDWGGKYSLKLVPSDPKIKLSTNEFEVEEGWTIQTNIESKAEIKGSYLQVKINDKDSSRISIDFTSDIKKDIFSDVAIKRLLDENTKLAELVDSDHPLPEYAGNYCMAAAERGISELLQDYKNFYAIDKKTQKRKNSVYFTGKTAIDRGNVMHGLGNVKSKWEFDKYKIDHDLLKKLNSSKNNSDANNVFQSINNDIITISEESKKALYNLFLKDISSVFGFHVYYFCIVGGFHTLLLIIDSTKGPCESTYAMYDQHGIKSKGQGKLSEIGEGFRAQSSFNFANSCLNRFKGGKTKYWDSTKTYLWKIQKK
ncbi:hypothetical protein [Flavobacterium hercynium]|uniref:Uncharacterized protein n=1 Tax=Flavobacterium hercynium TaxID=387094 RepID=A0A226H791_9FLAO|nr:hypothetical protein [Flavobacterium hercynium]OXA89516.1 hypothetical protein B0A66_13930 [Flavobacterium hercynium]SMP35933.1 hypothetical protein SAMN06265346_12053 [Flavobacterium hercynium]